MICHVVSWRHQGDALVLPTSNGRFSEVTSGRLRPAIASGRLWRRIDTQTAVRRPIVRDKNHVIISLVADNLLSGSAVTGGDSKGTVIAGVGRN